MIDTHAHISSRFCKNVDEIVEGAKNNGINRIILAASNIEESKENINLAQENRIFAACAGIHPQQTDPEIELSIDEQINLLDKLADSTEVVAIGECGLDFSSPPPEERERPREEQERLLRGQIAVAVKHNLPLAIHARKAVDETIEILAEFKDRIPGGVFHCYAGGKKRIKKIIDLGSSSPESFGAPKWYFGFDGNLTYEEGLKEVVTLIPKDRILIETDSPFLAPEPYRGQTNKPEYVRFVYQKVAEIWGMSFEETVKQIDENAKKLFGL